MPDSPPVFTKEDFAFGGGSSAATSTDAAGWVELIAFGAFFGTILFCSLQAMFAPRKTFCAENMAEEREVVCLPAEFPPGGRKKVKQAVD